MKERDMDGKQSKYRPSRFFVLAITPFSHGIRSWSLLCAGSFPRTSLPYTSSTRIGL